MDAQEVGTRGSTAGGTDAGPDCQGQARNKTCADRADLMLPAFHSRALQDLLHTVTTLAHGIAFT